MTKTDRTRAPRPRLPGATRRCRSAAGSRLLLAAMTLEEKVAQLGSRWVGNDLRDAEPRQPTRSDDADAQRRADAGRVRRRRVRAARGGSRHGLGHLTRVYGSAPVTAAEGAAELVRQQHDGASSDRGSASPRSSTRSA